MSDYTVSVTETAGNAVTAQDIINAVSISETAANTVSVVAATFVNDAGASSNLLYSTGAPSNSLGSEGDFYIDTAAGNLWGPKGASTWAADPMALIPKRFTHTQSSTSASWTITHTLNGYPSVTVVDSAGTVVIGEVKYDSTSQVTISFEAAFAGKAHLT